MYEKPLTLRDLKGVVDKLIEQGYGDTQLSTYESNWDQQHEVERLAFDKGAPETNTPPSLVFSTTQTNEAPFTDWECTVFTPFPDVKTLLE